MIETLQFGGGIVYVKPIYSDIAFEDFGFCEDFSIFPDFKEEFHDKYIRGVGDKLIRTKSSQGALTQANLTGSFLCQSFTRSKLQSIWFRGSSSSSGTEFLQESSLEPIIAAVKFLSVSNNGPVECLKFPKVSLQIEGQRKLMGYDWRNVLFTFSVFLEEGFMPTHRVQQEGETLTNFCE